METPGGPAGEAGSRPAGARDRDAAEGAGGSDTSPPFWLKEQLGFSIEKGQGTARAVMDCDERHLNPHGAVHGAVLFALLDTAMGAATMSVLDESSWCATIEIHTRFLEPVLGGRLSADVEVVKAGRRIVHLDGTITDERGRRVCKASGSFAVIPRPS
jgi:acyl-CoA thioesterase